jgi:hypothetical protein
VRAKTDDPANGRTRRRLRPYRGTVDIVHDGDTVNVKLDVGFALTVYTSIRIDGSTRLSYRRRPARTRADPARAG